MHGNSVPHDYRNALFWRWVPAMPKGLPSGFVSLLYALGSAADTSGRLRFKDGTIIRIAAIAAAIRADAKDVRRYMAAAIAAGVVVIDGEAAPGKAIAYAILIAPRPDWGAAEACLQSTKRRRGDRGNLPWKNAALGGTPPRVDLGGTPPKVEDPEGEGPWGYAPPPTLGVRPPSTLGVRPPYIPGSTQELPQEMAEVGGQPQVGDAPALHKIDSSQEDKPRPAAVPDDFIRCTRCHKPMIRRADGRTTHTHCIAAQPVQSPLLYALPDAQQLEPPAADHHATTA